MTREQEMVKEFHKTFDLAIGDVPRLLEDPELNALRRDLIQEELDEYETAVRCHSITEIADALGDLLYVVYGAAVTHGIDMEPIFYEIHRSNMSKVGGHRNEAGKWVKPDTYSPANLKEILAEQMWLGRAGGGGDIGKAHNLYEKHTSFSYNTTLPQYAKTP